MLRSANPDQQSVFRQVKNELEINSIAFVSGAAGTGKSYILRMFERYYYRLKGFKVCTLLSQFRVNVINDNCDVGFQISTNWCGGPQYSWTDHSSILRNGKSINCTKLPEFGRMRQAVSQHDSTYR